MIAFQLAGKATRDALFLSTFGVALLPRMVIAAAVLSAALSVLLARAFARIGPARLVPALFGLSALLLLGEAVLVHQARSAIAVVVYLHFTALGALLVSGFWALVNERFDPRAARGTIGRITAGASIGGLLGGILPERVGATFQLTAMLPILSALHVLAALLVLGVDSGAKGRPAVPRREEPGPSGFRILGRLRYLQGLGVLVALTAAAEGTLDYVFKARATEVAASGEELLRLFAAFYTVTALLGLIVQVSALRALLGRLGIARSAALLPTGVAAGAGASIFLPGLAPVLLARGTEVVLRNSLFRAAYEMLFTPVAPREKRATKVLLDVGAARIGDVVAGGVVQITLPLAGTSAGGILLGTTMLFSAAALLVARQLHRGYTAMLAGSLKRQTADLPGKEREDAAAFLQTAGAFDLTELRMNLADITRAEEAARPRPSDASPQPVDRRQALNDPDSHVVREALRDGPLTADLIEPVIGLLAWDGVAGEAIHALRAAAADHTSVLVRHLLNPDEDFAIRRRLVSVLGDLPEAGAVEGLVRALDDLRFEVRYRAGRALKRLAERVPGLLIDRERVTAVVLREVTVERSVWESRQLLDTADDDLAPPVADVLRDRADRSLEHVFSLLSLILPRATIQLAFEALHTDNPYLRGTALEYLETVLPDGIRHGLWPFLERGESRPPRTDRSPEAALRELLASRQSIVLALDAAGRRAGGTPQGGS
jgi:hypothetical protein